MSKPVKKGLLKRLRMYYGNRISALHEWLQQKKVALLRLPTVFSKCNVQGIACLTCCQRQAMPINQLGFKHMGRAGFEPA